MSTINPADRVRELMQGGLLCAESVLTSLAEAQGVHSELIPRIATGLCGGMSRSDRLCGAFTGGIMGVSLAFGRNSADISHEDAYAQCQEFMERFEQRFGQPSCTTLCGCDLSTPDGLLRFKQERVLETCRDMAAEAASMAWAVIQERDA